MRLLLKTPNAIAKDLTEQRKKAASKRGLWNFSDTRGVVKNYLGCGVDAGATGLGAAGFKGAGLAAAPAAGAGAGTPDCVL